MQLRHAHTDMKPNVPSSTGTRKDPPAPSFDTPIHPAKRQFRESEVIDIDDEDDEYDEDAVLDPREKARRDKERELNEDLNNAADLLGAAALGGAYILYKD